MNAQARQSPAGTYDDLNLPNTMRGVASSGGLHVTFFYKKVMIKSRDPELNGTYQDRLCVSKQPKGDRLTVATRFITEKEAQRQFPREYAHFKSTEDVPTDGTPLSELPGISQSQIALLVINGLRSIEDLCEITPDQAAQIGIDGTRAQKTALRWMSRREENSEVIDAADMEARYQAHSENIERQLKAAQEYVKNLEAKVSALQVAQGGRPVSAESQTVAIDGDGEGLEYDISKMHDPWGDGIADPDPDDSLNIDTDPMEDEPMPDDPIAGR